MIPAQIAEICHEANRIYCESLGDCTQTLWEVAPEWQKKSAVEGVRFHLANPNATPEDSHKEWLKTKEAEGWKYGEIKDVQKLEHPCMVPYGDLPSEQKVKDSLFLGIVNILRDQVDGDQEEGETR
jgi:hypothetical protein